MANNYLLKFAAILFFLTVLIITCSAQTNEEEDEEEEYILDTPFANTQLRSRFLATKDVIKKGTTCSQSNTSVCNGVSANNGTSILYCCKTHCRNVLGDKNNCGRCGQKCKYGQRCCGGTCTNVNDNRRHCGKCNRKCSTNVKCGNGFCGYA